MMLSSTTVFTVQDIRASLLYYRDKLGFDIAFEYGNPVSYAGLCAGDVTLHLISSSRTPREPGHGAVAIDVDDVDVLHADLVERGAKVTKAPATYDYGMRTFDVADLDGNMLLFGMETPTNRGR